MFRSQLSRSSLRQFSTSLKSSNATTAAAAAPAATTTTVTTKPAKRVGAFRGGFLGFFVGVSVTSAFVYGYLLDEYKDSNNVIIKDVLSLSKSIRVLEEHVKALENQSK